MECSFIKDLFSAYCASLVIKMFLCHVRICVRTWLFHPNEINKPSRRAHLKLKHGLKTVCERNYSQTFRQLHRSPSSPLPNARLALLEARRDARWERRITDFSHVGNKSKILWRAAEDLGLICTLDDELQPRCDIYVYCKSAASLSARSNSSSEIPVPEQELKWRRRRPTSVCICS